MKKFKKFLSKNSIKKNTIKHRYKLIALFLLILSSLFLIFSFKSVSAVRVDFLSLKNEIKLGQDCHEECRRERKIIKDQVIENISKDPRLLNDYKEYFLRSASSGDKEDRILRQELLQIAQLSENNDELIDFYIDYLILNEANPEAKSDIIRYLLSLIPDSGLAQYYFMILEQDKDNNLLTEAVRAISLLEPKNEFFSVNQLIILYNLLTQENILASLKMDILFLMNNYHLYYPEESKNFLKDVYYNFPDTPLQYMAAEFLNSLEEYNFDKPQIPESAWLPYF